MPFRANEVVLLSDRIAAYCKGWNLPTRALALCLERRDYFERYYTAFGPPQDQEPLALGPPRTPLPVLEERLRACQSCDHWRRVVCIDGDRWRCGHRVALPSCQGGKNHNADAENAFASCPLGYWGPWAEPSLGVCIGSWNLPRTVELQIRLVRHHCGPVPILIADDTDREKSPQRWAMLEGLSHGYSDVFFWPNEKNLGHYRGDASALSKSVQWGHTRGLRVVAKLSMRHFLDFPGWLQAGAKELLDSGQATASRECYDNGSNLYIRSECVFFDVPQWVASGAWKRFEERDEYRYAAEIHYNDVLHKAFGGKMHQLSFLKVRRNEYTPGVVWHCANPESDFHALASRHGVDLDSDFHGAGSCEKRGFASSYKRG